jgi:hypothetical protein
MQYYQELVGDAMKKSYRFGQLSKGEREFLEMILMEEIDVQAWYALTYSCILSEEVFMCVQ